VVQCGWRNDALEPTVERSHRISTIERLYPDQWVVVEVTRVSRAHQALAGRILAHAPDEDEITREAVKAAEERPTAHLWTFYTGALIPEGMLVVFGCR
jgi:hypothetical protein